MADSPAVSLHVRAVKGTVFLAATYDEELVEMIRQLPKGQRRFDRASREWVVPAHREGLRSVLKLVGQAEERGVIVALDRSVKPRFHASGVTRVLLRPNAVELLGPYDPARLPALRALPERRYNDTRHSWVVPLTRAGATATLALVDAQPDRFVVTPRARAALERTRRAREDVATPSGRTVQNRKAPEPHFRHVTRGPVFNAKHAKRVEVDGYGLCVVVRVDPASRRRRRRPSENDSASVDAQQ